MSNNTSEQLQPFDLQTRLSEILTATQNELRVALEQAQGAAPNAPLDELLSALLGLRKMFTSGILSPNLALYRTGKGAAELAETSETPVGVERVAEDGRDSAADPPARGLQLPRRGARDRH